MVPSAQFQLYSTVCYVVVFTNYIQVVYVRSENDGWYCCIYKHLLLEAHHMQRRLPVVRRNQKIQELNWSIHQYQKWSIIVQEIWKNVMVVHCRPSSSWSSFIRQYLKVAVASGELVHTKEKGASSSFKLSSGSSVAKSASVSEKSLSSKSKACSASKAKTPTKNPHAAEKTKATSENKTVAARARKAPREKKNAKAPKSPLRARRSKKSPTEKPKHLNPNVPSQLVVPLH